LSRFEQYDFHIEWEPYRIDPGTSDGGEDYFAYNKRRWGSDGWTYSMRNSAKSDGCNFASWKWWPNSLNALRLMELASEQGKQHETKEALFQSCYERGENPSTKEVCIEVANRVGLENAEDYMNSDQGLKEVLAKEKINKQKRKIRGVPYFIFNSPKTERPIGMSGAQSSNTFEEVINELL